MTLQSVSDMMALYKDFYAESGCVDFDVANVPADYRDLSMYARFWGIGDDISREDLVARAPSIVRRELAMAILGRHLSMLVTWLGGVEARGPEFSKAYIAYTNMIMAAEDAHFQEKRSGWDWKPPTTLRSADT